MMHNIIFPIGSNFPIISILHKSKCYALGNKNIFHVFVLCLHMKNSLSVILDQLVGAALHPLFCRMLAFAQLFFVLVES